MNAWLIMYLVLAAVCVACGLADQRKLWWRFKARRHSNPQAHEPSEGVLKGQRVVFFATAVLLGVSGWQAVG